MTIRVAIVDDQALMRDGFSMILDAQPDIDVVGDAENGRLGVELCQRTRPDVVLMDIRMPVLDGIEATRLDHRRATTATPRCSCSRRSISTSTCTPPCAPAPAATS